MSNGADNRNERKTGGAQSPQPLLPSSSVHVMVIKPSRGWRAVNLREIWEYRELLYFLAWRDVMVRYKQAALGVAWAVLQPLIAMVIFSVIFGKLAKLPSENIPYPIYSFAALLPWQLFAGALQRGGVSLVTNSQLVTKVYFPRLILPVSMTASGLVDFGVSFVVLVGMMFWYGITPTWKLLVIPLLVLYTLLTAVAVALWISALNVQYRDMQHTLPFLIQAWMYASPVAYSAELVPAGKWQMVYALNPMTGVIQGFRWALVDAQPPGAMLYVSLAIVVVLFVSGLFYFARMDRTFADIV